MVRFIDSNFHLQPIKWSYKQKKWATRSPSRQLQHTKDTEPPAHQPSSAPPKWLPSEVLPLFDDGRESLRNIPKRLPTVHALERNKPLFSKSTKNKSAHRLGTTMTHDQRHEQRKGRPQSKHYNRGVCLSLMGNVYTEGSSTSKMVSPFPTNVRLEWSRPKEKHARSPHPSRAAKSQSKSKLVHSKRSAIVPRDLDFDRSIKFTRVRF